MVDMVVPKIGDRVSVSSPGLREGCPPAGRLGTVLGVTQFVPGEGRYVNVKFDDGRTGFIHESRVKKATAAV